MAFFLLVVILVVYWLTEKPEPTQWDQMVGRTRRRSREARATIESGSKPRIVDVTPAFSGRVRLEPPKTIGTVPQGVGRSYTPPEVLALLEPYTGPKVIELPYVPPAEEQSYNPAHSYVPTDSSGHSSHESSVSDHSSHDSGGFDGGSDSSGGFGD